MKRIINFLIALIKYMIIGDRVDDHVYEDRISICEGCDNLTKERTCSICTCFIDVKAKWSTEECPKNKWPNV